MKAAHITNQAAAAATTDLSKRKATMHELRFYYESITMHDLT